MNEVRVVLCAFGVLALIMIGLPLWMLFSAHAAVPPDVALKGEVSAFFLATQPPPAPGVTRQTLPAITNVLPAGLRDQAAFDRLAASGFTCVPDANAASCFRAYDPTRDCAAEWRVSLTFDKAGTLKLSEADRRTTCS